MSENKLNKPEKELSTLEKIERARTKSNLYGYLGLTAQDHTDMGSSPPQEVLNNKGKATGEFLTDKKIEKFLEHTKSLMHDIEQRLAKKKNYNDEHIFKVTRTNFEGGIRYLQTIGRLPEKYKKMEKNPTQNKR